MRGGQLLVTDHGSRAHRRQSDGYNPDMLTPPGMLARTHCGILARAVSYPDGNCAFPPCARCLYAAQTDTPAYNRGRAS